MLDAGVDDVVDARAGVGALDRADQTQPAALGGFEYLQLVGLHALFFGEADGRRCPVAGLVPRAVERRPESLHRLVRRLQLDLGHQHCQAPRGGKPLHLAETELALLQAPDDTVPERQAKGFQCFGRQLFRAQLHQ